MKHTAADMRRETDEELMARFQAGDAEAMEVLFGRFQKPLFNFFLRMVGRRETAEDLVQETFLKLCRFGHSFRGSEAKFTTWLYSVAGNHCRDHLRHMSRRPESSMVELGEEEDDFLETRVTDTESFGSTSSVEEHILRVELHSIVKEAMATLPEKEREAIILREYQGLEYKEIAEVLSCPIGSVKVLIYRARQRLREKLRDADLGI
ncbi:MAG: sigma-70 family RNA polymerase sigma factor [Armatimonadetes bacterium]|nr:sigma-70 family RNA polymerase sigma factor [Armatimonadota bacterium]